MRAEIAVERDLDALLACKLDSRQEAAKPRVGIERQRDAGKINELRAQQAFGIGEIVVKNGPNSALVTAGGVSKFVPVPEVVEPVDPMAAGDGFNAGYIAARLSGDGPSAAAAAAHRLAGQVIRHRGAIMPRTAEAMH